MQITDVYNRDEALKVIKCSLQDYRAKFGAPEDRFAQLQKLLAPQT